MTPDKLTALAARLRDHASDYITHPDDACKHSDLLAAAEYLRQCAQAEPVATVRVHNTGGNAGIAWSGVPTEHAGTMRGGTPLYTHPQPQQAGVPGRWADIVEQRLLTWRQRFTNRSGDQLALDDFMDQQSIDDLVDFVCDEHAAPHPPIAFPFPASYDTASDTLTINGKRYAAGLFDERGLLAPAGTVVRIEDGPDDTVTLTRLQQPPSAQAEPTIDINIKIAVPANWSNRLDMQWIVEREIHADRWSWSYAAPQAMNTQADAVEALRWEKPGPVSPNHPIECLIVLSALRQSDGDWWIRGDKFLADYLPIAWAPDTPEARAVLAAQGGNDV